MPRRVSVTQRERLYTRSCEHPRRYIGEPRGYLDWFDWAERMSKTHDQKLCPHCGLYALWVERGAGETRREVFEELLEKWIEAEIVLAGEIGEDERAGWLRRYEEASDG